MWSECVFELSPDLEQELEEAVAAIERGDCAEPAPELADEWTETDELYVQDEWLTEAND